MLGIDESRSAAKFLRFGDGVQRKRGLTARFRSEDFNDTAAWKSADAESRVERQ